MEVLELDDNEIREKTMMCPDCGLPLYQKDKRFKFFLFSCRACSYQVQLDYEFSWETCKIKKQSILPGVKQQRGSTCDPNAIVTAVESSMRFQYAKEDKIFKDSLSVDDLIKQHEDIMGPGFTWESDMETEKNMSRSDNLGKLMEANGVMTDKDFKSKKQAATRYKAKPDVATLSFEASCKRIMKGSVLHASIPITERFDSLSGDEIYIADVSQIITDTAGTNEYHAIVLVGFGVKDQVKFFRFMNSHGTNFGKKGFGNVRAKEIKTVTSFKPLMK